MNRDVPPPHTKAVCDDQNTGFDGDGPTAESRKADDLARKFPVDQGDRGDEGDVKTVTVAHRFLRWSSSSRSWRLARLLS